MLLIIRSMDMISFLNNFRNFVSKAFHVEQVAQFGVMYRILGVQMVFNFKSFLGLKYYFNPEPLEYKSHKLTV